MIMEIRKKTESGRHDLARQYRSLLRRKLDSNNRANLVNRDFSIICSNCVGGVISHSLGLPFKSPTVNVFLYPKDYLKLIYHLRHYMTIKEMPEDREASILTGYRVGILDDIRLYFGHCPDFQWARTKWFERSERVNYDNLYFIMIERDGCKEDDLRKFDKYPSRHKVVFTTRERPDLKSAYYIPGATQDGQVIDLVGYKGKMTGRRWIDDFDYVSFLNDTGI